ncbi:hypothetical protein M406DRAFT_73652 [Cryphonectria parasitica EP155]|uniref:FAD-binding PCMH-type domain-containing protein n=1 Tax=Cryphonectria parasitica (strain ATCC 38755 / EP155) TaxID=660469 RepID=A0A9P5CLE9_CRYP1|nr:uncharacterized protein M406DRAFT_73652 [Cryphonectria parasitica EP155]KAF3762993.1 hypothetical protein M406DRAFT_73652 [Cryphonectria parasitica EP155]
MKLHASALRVIRDIGVYVRVSEDKKTAKVGGDVLSGSLLKALGEHGLITASGSTGSVGCVGWTTAGGYGPFSSLYGLGIDQIVAAKLVNGNCIVNATEAKTVAKYSEDNEKLVSYGIHGRTYTVSLKAWTPTSVRILVTYSASVPGGNSMISIHGLRSPPANEDSVFGAREDHHMVEIISLTTDPALEGEVSAWGQGLLRELKEQDASNIVDSAYLPLLDYGEVDSKKIYGRHNETVVSLKKKYDPENVFKHAAPRVIV